MNAEATGADTMVLRRSDRDVVVIRRFDAPVDLVFEAWSRPELFERWWVPQSCGFQLLSCQMDVRTGGTYSLTFGQDSAGAMTFHGKYLDVTPASRIVWTNDESESGAVTSVTFEERDGGTLLILNERYPSPQALEEAFDGLEGSMPEQFGQLDALLRSRTGNA